MPSLLRLSAVALALALPACASTLDPEGAADRTLIRHSRVMQAQDAANHAGVQCAADAAEAAACLRRDQLTAELRKQGFCLRPGDPKAPEGDARRYDLWIACS